MENNLRIINFTASKHMIIRGTYFQHNLIVYRYIWRSPPFEQVFIDGNFGYRLSPFRYNIERLKLHQVAADYVALPDERAEAPLEDCRSTSKVAIKNRERASLGITEKMGSARSVRWFKCE